jgi:hypothetical protein
MTKMLRVLFTVGALTALWLGAVAPSQADPLQIKLPDFSGPITGFDPGPGNLLITGITSGRGILPGDVLETYFQANMSALIQNGSQNFTPPQMNNTTSGQGYELTVVARFTEKVSTIVTAGNTAVATFVLNGAQTNPFFEIWYHPFTVATANNFAGTGFAVGTKILSGVIGSINSSSFTVGDFTVTTKLENPAAGTVPGHAFWDGTQTVQGTGNNNINLTTMGVNNVVLNPNFFPGGQSILTYLLRPGTGLEYHTVDASKQFDAQPNGGGFISSTAQQNQTNAADSRNTTGLLLLEIDDQESFTATTSALPEPSSMLLSVMGAGVVGAYRLVRRRRQENV